MSETPWWRDAVTYQVYIRSFSDSDGDGTGDIGGLIAKLPYIKSLGVDAIWVNPWYPSPLNDGGYDVADYRDINPQFGTLDQAKELIAKAADAGIKIIVDLVPNHTSSEHVWFQQALRSHPGSEERARYHFTTGRGTHSEEPPNNWRSVFGGPAWTRVHDGDWYLHLFDVTQPDLNWDNEEVRSEVDDVLRFWLDLGAAGFRIDVAHGVVKEPGYPDADLDEERVLTMPDHDHPFWDRPRIHEIIRRWRSVLDEYEGSVMVAEAWVPDWERLKLYVRPDEYHQTFDFHTLKSAWRAASLRDSIQGAMTATASVGSVPSWVLSNHDVIRHVTRYGLDDGLDEREWLNSRTSEGFDLELGTRRARAALLLVLALPGSVYLYQGEELGLPEVHDLPDAVLDDPVWLRSGHADRGRDGCRVPIPWTTSGQSFGFGSDGSWLPQPDYFGDLSVEAQDGVEGSVLELYRAAMRARTGFRGQDEFEWLEAGEDVVAFSRGGRYACFVNFGDEPVSLPDGEIVISSADLVERMLPTDAAAWVVTA